MVFQGYSLTNALDEKVRFVDEQVNTFSRAFLGRYRVHCATITSSLQSARADYYASCEILARIAQHAKKSIYRFARSERR